MTLVSYNLILGASYTEIHHDYDKTIARMSATKSTPYQHASLRRADKKKIKKECFTMKKIMTSLATVALLTSAVPAFAQEGQQAPVTTAITQNSSSNDLSKASVDQQEFQDIEVRFNHVPNVDRYKWVRYNVTDGYEDMTGTAYTTSTKIYSLSIGKLYRIHAYALDQNNNVIAVSNAVEIRGTRGQDTVIYLVLK